MNIENLHTGQEIRNYKELCRIINEPIKAGKSKQLQLERLNQYCNFHKNRQSFTIDKIDRKKLQNSKIEFIKILELLFLDYLSQPEQDGKAFLSKNKILKTFRMINENYIDCSQKTDKLSKFMNINTDTINEFYDSTDSLLQRNIEKALDSLKSQSLILWSKEITVCEILIDENSDFDLKKDIIKNIFGDDDIAYNAVKPTRYAHREATEEEKKYILRIEREYLLLHGFNNKQDIIKHGKWDEFRNYVNQHTLDNYHIAFNYVSYKFLFNEDQILAGYIDFLKFLMEKSERTNNYEILNAGIAERLLHNITNKQYAARKTLSTNEFIPLNKEYTLNRRNSDSYIEDNQKLINLLVDSQSQGVKFLVEKEKSDNEIDPNAYYSIIDKNGLNTGVVKGDKIKQ